MPADWIIHAMNMFFFQTGKEFQYLKWETFLIHYKKNSDLKKKKLRILYFDSLLYIIYICFLSWVHLEIKF
jgi:hypothetical protein